MFTFSMTSFVVKRELQDLCTVPDMRNTEYGTDHSLVRGKLKLYIKLKIRYNGTKIHKHIDISRLRGLAICEDLQIAFEDSEFDGT